MESADRFRQEQTYCNILAKLYLHIDIAHHSMFGSLGSTAAAVSSVVIAFATFFRPVTRKWHIVATLPRPAKEVFAFHLDPVRFYSVLDMDETRTDFYKVLSIEVDDDQIAYHLSHEFTNSSKKIESHPLRFNIDRTNLKFDEEFEILKTTFSFNWQISEALGTQEGEGGRADVDLKVTVAGPALLVYLFGEHGGGGVQNVWDNRFRITEKHIDELIPLHRSKAH